LLTSEGATIIDRVTPIEIARELELLRPFLKELMVMSDARDRVLQGSTFTQRDPPDETIDKLIISVLTEAKSDDAAEGQVRLRAERHCVGGG
jgi:hypothetical protein